MWVARTQELAQSMKEAGVDGETEVILVVEGSWNMSDKLAAQVR